MLRAHRALPLCFLSLFALAATGEEESCAANGKTATCHQASGDSVAAKEAVAVPTSGTTADLLTQEVEELEALVRVSNTRISLLRELRGAIQSGQNMSSVPEVHARALREKVPLMSEVASDVDRIPAAASEDYLVSKAIITQDDPVSFVKFLPLRNPRSSSTSTTQQAIPSALLVAAQSDSTVRLFSPSGELVLTFFAGHEQPVTHLTVSPSHDEYLVATGDAGGIIRVHKVIVRQRRLTKDEKQARRNSSDEKVSQYLGSSVNVTTQLHRQMQVPAGSDGEAPRVTALAMASQQGSKYFVAGDAEGKISVFTKNGTLRATIDTTATPGAAIEGLYANLGNLLFRAGSEWGYVDVEKQEVKHVECPKFDGHVTAAIIDSQQSSRVLVADEAGTVWIFSIKNKKDCTVELRFAKGTTRAPIDLASVRGFVLGLERSGNLGEPASMLALNMSQAGKRKNDLTPPQAAVVWRRSRPPVRSWAVHKRYQQGDLVAFLSEDGHEIEIMELLMSVYSAPATDSFGNFKLPVIAVAIVLVLGYQYVKQKGKLGGGLGGGGLGKKYDFGSSDFAALKNKRKLAGLKSKKF